MNTKIIDRYGSSCYGIGGRFRCGLVRFTEVNRTIIVLILLANSRYSKFFSPITEYHDSLNSTPSGKDIFNRMMNVGNSVKTILGYECTIAETDHHGRHWTVWFSPGIPLQDGPWKLCGLPGLILE